MREPTLSDLFGNLYDQDEDLVIDDLDTGDPTSGVITIPNITTIGASVAYYNSPITKQALARITWTWTTPLIYDEDGAAVDPSDPDIQDDLNFDPVVNYMFGTLSGAGGSSYRSTGGATTVVTEGHPTGIDVTLSIYAVLRSGVIGPVATYTAAVTKDTTPPPAPSTPTLISNAATVTVTFDGLTATATAQPADYNYTEILADTSNPPTTPVGKLFGAGKYSFQAVAGSTIYVRLVSYDNVLNQSTASAVASIVVKSILDDSPLSTLLATKATIYHQDADPITTNPTTVANGDWWFTKTAPILIKNRAAGAWVIKAFNADQILASETVVTTLLAANSVTADKVATEAIIARHIAAGTITADMINSGVLNALITVTGVLRTAESGKRVVLDQSGVTLYDASDIPITFINTNGTSTFNGDVTANTLEVVGAMQLDAAGNRMLPGSTLILGAQVQAPPNAPIVSAAYNKVTLLNSTGGPLNPALVSRMSDGKFISSVYNTADYKYYAVINNADGTYSSTLSYPGAYGCLIGNYLYKYNGGSVFQRMNITTGVVTTYTVPANPPLSNAGDGGQPTTAVYGSGTTLFVTQWGTGITSGSFNFREFTIVEAGGDNFTLTYVGRAAWGTSINSPAYRSNLDVGSDSILNAIYQAGSEIFNIRSYSTGTVDSTKTFYGSSSTPVIGMGYYGGKIWAVQGTAVTFYEASALTSYAVLGDFAYTYYDTVGTVSESKKSPTKSSVLIYNRSLTRVSVSGWTPDTSTVDSVSSLRFYGNKTVGGTLYAQGITATGYIDLTTIATSGSTPPSVSTFPILTPASIMSDNGLLSIDASGVITAAKVIPSAQPGARLSRATQTIATSSWTRIQPNVEVYDTASMGDNVTNYCINIPETGMYAFGASLVTEEFVAAHPTRVAISTLASGITTESILTESSFPDSNGIHGHVLYDEQRLTASTSLYLWYKFDSATSHVLSRIVLWARRIG